MENIEKIIKRIETDNQNEINEVASQAKSKCDDIAADYAQKAQRAYEQALEEGKNACASRTSRIHSTAGMEAKKNILTFKQDMVSKAFELSEEKLSQLDGDKYVTFLVSQVVSAAQFGTEELVFNASDKAKYASEVAKGANSQLAAKGFPASLTVCEEVRDITGGVILKRGDIETNCTLKTLMQLHRNELASQVAEMLFA